MTFATVAQLDVRVVQLQRSHNALALEVSATAAAIRQQILADWDGLSLQVSLIQAELDAMTNPIVLRTMRPNQTVLIANPNPIPIRVVILCTTTNLGPPLTVPANGTATFTDASDGDVIKLISIYPFTAVLEP